MADKLDFEVLGTTGLRQFSGYVYEEFLPELQGYRGRQIFREMMDNDPVIGAILFAVEMLIRRVEFRVDPGDDTPEADEAAKFIDSCLADMETTWEDTLSEILTFLPFGFEVSEVLLKRRLGASNDPTENSKFNDGRIAWRSWSGRAQETLLHWEFDEFQRAMTFVQLAPPDYKIRKIPLNRCLHFRTTAKKANPEGRSIMRNAYRPWYFKKHIENIEGIGIERDLAGLPVAWVPPELLSQTRGANETAMYNMIKKIVTNIRRDDQEGVVWPLQYDKLGNKLYDITLLSTGGQRQFDTDKIVSRYDQRIAMVVLADFILLGHEAVGSKALSNDKTDLFADAISAWLDAITDEINNSAIVPLLALNGMDTENPPRLAHGDIQSTDLGVLGAYIENLAKSGMPLFPNESLEAWLKRQANMPDDSATTEEL